MFKEASIVNLRFKANLTKLSCIFLLMFISQISSFAQESSTDGLNKIIQDLAANADVKKGIVGFSVYDVERRQPIYQFNGQKFIRPASILKLLTTGIALDKYEPGFTVETVLGYNGYIEDGTLNGNLVVKGFGDPTFCSDRFGTQYQLTAVLNLFLSEILNKGIHQINGNIVVDASYFGGALISPKWLWEDIGNYYGAGAGGFNFFENKYVIEFRSKATGEKTELISTYPSMDWIGLTNEVVAGKEGTGDEAYVFGGPFANQQFIRGTIPPNKNSFKIKAANPNPALTFAKLLKSHLAANNISCNGIAESHYYFEEDARLSTQIVTHQSPELKDIIYYTNLKSINLYAEFLLKILALDYNNFGFKNTGLAAMGDYFKSEGFSAGDYLLFDGSGLSPSNKVTPDFFTENLVSLYHSKNKEAWLNSFTIPGHPKKSGYFNMLKGTAAENNLMVKSGYIDGVRSFAGFIKNKQNKLLAFTFVVNDYTCPASKMKQLMIPVIIYLAEN